MNKKIVISLFSLVFVINTASVSAKELIIGGSGADLGTMRQVAEAFTKQNPEISVNVLPSLGSGGGVKAVAKGRIDIGLISRPIKSKEEKYALRSYVYARTPLIFVTGKDNNATDISSETYIALLKGEARKWPDGQLIRLVLRPARDSDTLKIQNAFPETKEAYKAAFERRLNPIAESDQVAVEEVMSLRGGLSTSTLALVLGEKRDVKALSLDGVAPTITNVSNGQYALFKTLAFVLPESPDDAAVKFIEFIKTSKGKMLLEKTGHMVVPFELE